MTEGKVWKHSRQATQPVAAVARSCAIIGLYSCSTCQHATDKVLSLGYLFAGSDAADGCWGVRAASRGAAARHEPPPEHGHGTGGPPVWHAPPGQPPEPAAELCLPAGKSLLFLLVRAGVG